MAARKFSTRSALAFVLPVDLQGPVQSIRKIHDKAYGRWPPHINFFFPFIFEEEIPAVIPRIREALARIQPFTTVLNTVGNFSHGKSPSTIWLGPENTEPFQEIFNALAPLFPTLTEGARKEFVPHMTLGQASGKSAVDTATSEFKGIVGSITCLVDSLQILVRDADTPFESLYTVFLGGREPVLHSNVANRALMRPGAANEDDALMQDAAPKERPAVSLLLHNKSVTGPRDCAELLGAKKEAEGPAAAAPKEKPLKHFFDDEQHVRTSAVAVDTSGSTSGSILRWSIAAVKQAVLCNGVTHAARTDVLNRTISWNHAARVLPIDSLRAGGCTEPKVILPFLPPTVKNLLMTTDGEISTKEVNALREALKTSSICNVVAFIVEGRSVLERSPSRIEMSVFFPLLEHCVEHGGTFLLFFVTKAAVIEPAMKAPRLESQNEELEARLLIKHQSERCARFSPFPDPPASFDETVTWNDVPLVKLQTLTNLLVDTDPTAAPRPAANEDKMLVPGIQGTVNMVAVAMRLCEMTGPQADEVFRSIGMDQFICDVLPQLLEEGKVVSAQLASTLRLITQRWTQLNLARIEEETRNPRCTELLEMFQRLNEQRASGSGADVRAELARVGDELRPLLQTMSSQREYMNGIVRSVSSRILERLAEISAATGPDDASMLPEAFTLDAVTKKMANRIRRAKVLAPENLANAEEAENSWDLTNAPLVCNECLVCMRDKVPAAMLAVDITDSHTNVLALNVSDVGIDDALTTGLWNTVAFPAGNFCVSCAFACAALGQHPMTRQRVSAVIPCVDLSIKANRTAMHNNLCHIFYGGKSLPSASLVFYGALEGLKREQRFPDELISAYQENLLNHTRCNLFPENSPLGKTEGMLEAMRSSACIHIDRMVPETWLVSLRNRSIPSIAMIAETVVAHDSSAETLKSASCLMRRQFFKTVATAVLNASKRNPANLEKMRHAIEHDLFQSNACCAVVESQRLVSAKSSNLLKILFSPKSYGSLMNGMDRFLKNLKMDDFDNFISPAAFSAFMAYVYENITRAPLSASQRKVEDFLSQCFVPTRKPSGTLLSDAFFDGAILTPDGDSSALAAVLDAAPYKNCVAAYHKALANGHTSIPRFAPSHLFSPAVSHCGTCGRSFLTGHELALLTGAKNRGRKALSTLAADVVDDLKKRRCLHFAEVYSTKPDSTLPTSSSSVCSLHDSVRSVCSQPQFIKLNVPTREVILAVVNNLMSRSEPGFVYKPDFLHSIAICAADFMAQRATMSESARLALSADLVSIRDRLVSEVQSGDLSGVSLVPDTVIDPELLRQLTEPVPFDVAAESVVSTKKTDDDDDSM